ncbi:MAG: DUF2461 domain-containing protein [Pseudomonadota bacterium]
MKPRGPALRSGRKSAFVASADAAARANDKFRGFPPACFRFLRDLAENNDRNWFEAHRDIFETSVLAPSHAFVNALGRAMRPNYPTVVFDPAVNGTGSMFRIARDVRFSKDKSPYKTNLGFRFWLSEEARAAKRVGLYVNVAATGVTVYGGAHGLEAHETAEFRNHLLRGKNGVDLQRILDRLGALGFGRHGDALQRVPAGFPKDHPQADLARYKDLMAVSPTIDVSVAGTPALIRACADFAKSMKPLNDWFQSVPSSGDMIKFRGQV